MTIQSILARIKPVYWLAGTTGLVSLAVSSESENASEVAIMTAAFLQAHEVQEKQDKIEEEGVRLMKTLPSFPHLLVISPRDDPHQVISRLLEGGTRLRFDDITQPTLVMPELASPRHLWVAFLRILRSIQYNFESGFSNSAYSSRVLAHHRNIVTQALQNIQAFDEARTISMCIAIDRSLLDEWDGEEQTRMHMWFQALCSNHLAHVAWTTTPMDLIRRFVIGSSDSDVCLLVRPRSGIYDGRSASDKLAVLMGKLGFSLSDAEQTVVLDRVGNWWADLEALCSKLQVAKAEAGGNDDVNVVEQVCAAFQEDVETDLRSYLHLDSDLFAASRAEQDDALDKWAALQRLCGLGSDLELLAGPQALVRRDKPNATLPVPTLLSVFSRSGVDGDRRFWEMLAGGWMYLETSTDVAIGVVPCAPVEICRDGRVVLRPVVEKAFRRIWMDDANWKTMHELQNVVDEEELHDQLVEYEADIDAATSALEAKRSELQLAWSAFTDAEQAQHRANLHLDELKIQLQREHVERLRLVYQKRR
ncbi:hypothetical protein LEN26_009329 [Aphanomyces euteiches]|nr:hypothetical protein AeMF1_009368 [Aphanomyces euteiches]KAH9126851.1 hypothetical protein LEN26_009329 [Aphanomyces euteiches]KAH9197844.1 hypothetical protein AeNC1_000211 [Aphanomyces euteiches]